MGVAILDWEKSGLVSKLLGILSSGLCITMGQWLVYLA